MPKSQRIFKKRVYHGKKCQQQPRVRNTDNPTSSQPRPSPSAPSSSAKKLSDSSTWYNDNNDEFEYDIVNLKNLENILSEVAVCKYCQCRLTLDKQHISGLACQIILSCMNCGETVTKDNSEYIERSKGDKKIKYYDLNLRLVLGLRSIGKGRTAAEKLCETMNLSPPVNRYFDYENELSNSAETVTKQSMEAAVKETVSINNDDPNIAVAIDGSWQRRGHQSLNGIVSATSLSTGKVMDIEILSKYCVCKGRLKNEHETDCIANYSGSSGAIEVTGAINIFHRSEQLYNCRYVEYLGDGDTKAYLEVSNSKPYGEIEITKAECIGHIQKRMGSRLKALKVKTAKLPNKKRLGGKNRLTNAAVIKLQEYYGLAIKRNHKSVNDMKQAIWALYFHVLSTNSEPQHGLCPQTDDTWCKYVLAKKKNEEYDHDPKKHFHLPQDVMTFIKPIFRDLADPKLLEKCVMGKTQNPNESLNNVIWAYIPKRTFVGLKTLRFGVNFAVSNFNDGNVTACKIIANSGLKAGKNFVAAMRKLDQRRVAAAEKAQNELEKKIRKSKNVLKRRLEDQFEEEEGQEPAYAAGMY